MKHYLHRLMLFSWILIPGLSYGMTPEKMVEQVLALGEDVVQDTNMVNFRYRGIDMMLVFDTNADRMRLVSPIVPVNKVGNDVLVTALEANFHSVLDVRYAISNDLVWSAFIHPLSDLSDKLLVSAINQVAIAHATFGGDYTSGALIFPNQAN